MKFIVVIPSYKRADTIGKKSLNVLRKYNFPNNRIYIFVANQEEKKLYENKLYIDNKTDNKTDNKYNIIIGELGLANQRNFIRNYFPEGTKILSMDDDVEEINYLVDSRHEDIQEITEKRIIKTKVKKNFFKRESPSIRKKYILKPIQNFENMIEKTFELAIKNKINLWGVYPINNPYFMSNRISTDLKLITGPFFGFINQHNKHLENTINEKEDVERTIQYYLQDGAVLRLNNLVVKTSYYRNSGGMQFEGKNRKEEALKSSKYLADKYPELTRLDTSKKSGYAEVRLKDKRNIEKKY